MDIDLSKTDLEPLVAAIIYQGHKRIDHLRGVLDALSTLEESDHVVKVESHIKEMIDSISRLVESVEKVISGSPRSLSTKVEDAAVQSMNKILP